jgi:hypothetical protein
MKEEERKKGKKEKYNVLEWRTKRARCHVPEGPEVNGWRSMWSFGIRDCTGANCIEFTFRQILQSPSSGLITFLESPCDWQFNASQFIVALGPSGGSWPDSFFLSRT